MRKSLIAFACLLTVAGCGDDDSEQVPGEVVGRKLNEAAEQSSPKAQEILQDAAAEARGKESLAPVDEEGSFAQEAMQKVGNAEPKADATIAPPTK